MRQEWNHRRKCELQTLRAIGAAAPKGAVWYRDIDDPLAISREVHVISGNSGLKGQEPVGVAVITHKFGTWEPAIGKELLAIKTGNTEGELHWTGCELHGESFLTHQAISLTQCEDLIAAGDSTIKEIIAAIGSPYSAAFLRWIVPGAQ